MLWDLFLVGIGFVAGWVFFKRPQWATDAIAWVKGKFGVGQ